MIENTFAGYVDALKRVMESTEVALEGRAVPLEDGVKTFLSAVKTARQHGRRIYWMGNGGSAAIAAHEANDFMKNGDCRSQAFHEATAITCISNDFGYASYFEQMIARFADKGDIAVFISSSGASENVVRGALEARKRGCIVVALTGFAPDNRLRSLGDLSFYAPSSEYGYVELAHQVLCHAVLDFLYQEDRAREASAAALLAAQGAPVAAKP
jgi:D-sedoheptulose 7-phosphate isomerase